MLFSNPNAFSVFNTNSVIYDINVPTYLHSQFYSILLGFDHEDLITFCRVMPFFSTSIKLEFKGNSCFWHCRLYVQIKIHIICSWLGIVDFDPVNSNGIRNIKESELNALLQKNHYFAKSPRETTNNYFIDVFGVAALLYDGRYGSFLFIGREFNRDVHFIIYIPFQSKKTQPCILKMFTSCIIIALYF